MTTDRTASRAEIAMGRLDLELEQRLLASLPPEEDEEERLLREAREAEDAEIEAKAREWDRRPDGARRPKQPEGILPLARDLGAFLREEIAPPDFVLEPFLPVGGSGILFSLAGVAKTWLAHRLALSVAKGEPWIGFNAPKPRRVLLVDGELSISVLHRRLVAVHNGAAPPPERMVSVLCAEDLMRRRGRPLDLGDETDREALLAEIFALAEEKRPELVVLDNLAALWIALEENDNGRIGSEVNGWIARLRFLGCAVLLVHHAPKDGVGRGPRGGSALTGPVDFVIGLDPKPDSPHPHFTLTFTKQRHERVPHPSLEVELLPGPHGMVFKVCGPGNNPMRDLLAYIAENPPESQKALARSLGEAETTLRRRLDDARQRDLLKGLTLTPKGREYVGLID